MLIRVAVSWQSPLRAARKGTEIVEHDSDGEEGIRERLDHIDNALDELRAVIEGVRANLESRFREEP